MSSTPRTSLGLRGQLLAWVLPILALAVIGMGAMAILSARSALTHLVDSNLAVVAENLADALGRALSDSNTDAVTTARLDLVAEAIESGDPKNFVWYANELVRGKGRYVAAVISDETGEIVGASTVGMDGRDLPRPLAGVSLAQAEWRKRAYESERATATLAGPLEEPALTGLAGAQAGVFTISRPVIDILDERIGTLTLFVSVAVLQGSLAMDGAGSRAFIVDASGAVRVAPEGLNARDWRFGTSDSVHWTSPEGDVYRVSTAPIGGAFADDKWRLVTTSSAARVEAPLDSLTARLGIALFIALLVASLVVTGVAGRMVAPILRLTRATSEAMRAADFKPLAVERHDEVGALATSFNRMMTTIRDYEVSLEDKVAERTRALAEAQREITDILENIEQGIFTINAEGRVNAAHSASCKRIFGEEIAGRLALDVLHVDTSAAQEGASRMQFWLANIFGTNELQWILSEADPLAEVSFTRDGNLISLELEYAPIYVNGAIAKVMVVAKDVTRLRVLTDEVRKRDEQNQTNLARVAEIVALDPELFRTFIVETEHIFTSARQSLDALRVALDDKDALAAVFRAIHTLKGNARVFKLTSIQNAAHQVEEILAAMRSRGSSPTQADLASLTQGMDGLEQLRKEFTELGARVLGSGAVERSNSTGISEAKVQKLRRATKDLMRLFEREATVSEELRQAATEVTHSVHGLTRAPLKDMMERYRTMLGDLAKELGREVHDLEVVGGDAEVDVHLGQLLRDALLHALRNAVDHGIEPPHLRSEAGKSTKGKVAIHLALEGGALLVAVRDDGRGVDFERVRAKAFAQGFLSEEAAKAADNAELLELLFTPGFSTAESVTEVSGRGVGMDVIRSSMRKIRGEARMQSTKGSGTTLELSIPVDYYQEL